MRCAHFSPGSNCWPGVAVDYPTYAPIQGAYSQMFCPNCSQAFQPEKTSTCPNCGSSPAYGRHPSSKAARVLSENRRSEAKVSADTSAVDAGVRKGLYLILIGVALLPVYKILGWLYPANDNLINGTRSVELFETAGQGILAVLFIGGILRVAYAMTVVRSRILRSTRNQ